MLPEDAEWWTTFARDLGFQSRSQLITTILERLYLCGMSPAGSAILAKQILHRLDERNKRGVIERRTTFDFDSLLRPPPALPEEAPTSASPEDGAPAELIKRNPKTT